MPDIRHEERSGPTASDFEQFEAHLHYERGCSPKTIRTYRYLLAGLQKSLGRGFLRRDPECQPSIQELRQFLMYRDDLKPATRELTLSAYRAWRRFGVLEGWWDYGPEMALKAPPRRSQRRASLTPSQTQLLLMYATDPIQVRVVYLGLYAGLRISEMPRVDASIWLDDRLRISGKGAGGMSKEREVPVHPVLASKRDVILSLPRSGTALVRCYTKMRKALGFEFTPHTLRRTFASQLLDSEVPLEIVEDLLGHSPGSTTLKHYAGVSFERKRRAILSLSYDREEESSWQG